MERKRKRRKKKGKDTAEAQSKISQQARILCIPTIYTASTRGTWDTSVNKAKVSCSVEF